MLAGAFFIIRILMAWAALLLVALIVWNGISNAGVHWAVILAGFALILFVLTGVVSHVQRVKLIAGHLSGGALENRQRLLIDIPYEAGEAFDLVDAAIRELPGGEEVHSARDSLQVRAVMKRAHIYGQKRQIGRKTPDFLGGGGRNQISATIAPGEDVSALTLICQPEGGAWRDWFVVDGGVNLENAWAIKRAITRRVGERRRAEQAAASQTSVEKELAVARLGLLHAQVEPHFLYNTLASAQHLTRTDAAGADEMLGHLITYLRHSLPRTGDRASTLGEELDRTRAYLEILKVRMGERLSLDIDASETLHGLSFPAMMLQTLVENAIKHGLEAKPEGGGIWIRADAVGGIMTVTVADNGLGFNDGGSGTGIGLRNLRERLRLTYGDRAAFAIVANYPSGVAATITMPAEALAAATPQVSA